MKLFYGKHLSRLSQLGLFEGFLTIDHALGIAETLFRVRHAIERIHALF